MVFHPRPVTDFCFADLDRDGNRDLIWTGPDGVFIRYTGSELTERTGSALQRLTVGRIPHKTGLFLRDRYSADMLFFEDLSSRAPGGIDFEYRPVQNIKKNEPDDE